jgi:hypothetical protein
MIEILLKAIGINSGDEGTKLVTRETTDSPSRSQNVPLGYRDKLRTQGNTEGDEGFTGQSSGFVQAGWGTP